MKKIVLFGGGHNVHQHKAAVVDNNDNPALNFKEPVFGWREPYEEIDHEKDRQTMIDLGYSVELFGYPLVCGVTDS